MSPDLSILKSHIDEAGFQIGIDEGMWGISDPESINSTWPYIILWVAATKKIDAPDKYYFRFQLDGYPASPPTACPWNHELGQRLADHLWPKGNKYVSAVFRPGWNPNALYAPCDRVAMPGHAEWQTKHKDLWWQPTFKIEKYLQFIHRLLNSADYADS